MLPLIEKMLRQIRLNGPMPVSEFMTLALTDPDHGYYTTKDPFGRQGDFTTAPEISQMFGELIGLWCATVWQAMGSPDQFLLIEFGPGRGTLMADMMRAIEKASPACWKAAEIRLVEVSPTLRRVQEAALKGSTHKPPTWHNSAADLPKGAFIAIGNEFLDALPIRQFLYRDQQWHELSVGENAGALAIRPGPVLPNETFPRPSCRPPDEGDVFETSPQAEAFALEMAQRLKMDRGTLLLIDYGHVKSDYGDTLQAVRDHQYVPVLESPGSADLTAHVDFGKLAEIFTQEGLSVPDPETQGDFLMRLGIGYRAEALCSNANREQEEEITSALHRLTDSKEMGTLFKVLAVSSPDLPPPPGFE